jgi:hypothetical protein
MSSLAATMSAAPTYRRRLRRHAALGAAIMLAAMVAAVPARGQTTLSHTEDASPVPEGMLRFNIVTAWTRYDQRFTPNGLAPLSADFSTDALGPAQLPLLAPAWAGMQTLANNPNVRLSLGRLDVGSNVRIVTTPISLEYGLTSRLTIGVVVPVVQTRRVARARVNEDTSAAVRGTVGYVPVGPSRNAAALANLNVANAFQTAADSLGARITRCQQNPAGAGCAAVNSNAAVAAAARAEAQSFAAAARVLGVDSAHAIVAPLAKTALADSIDAQRLLLNQQLQQFLGAGYGATSGIYTAPYAFSYIDLQGNDARRTQGLLQTPLGGGLDSIYTRNRIGIGDIAIRAQFLVFDHFQRDSLPVRGLQSRLAVGGAWRFNTSRPDSSVNLVGIATGDGPGVELHSAMDLIAGHFGSTVVARYLKFFPRTQTAALLGDPEAPWPFPLFGSRQRTAGTIFGLDVTPRLLLDESFSIDGAYGLERVGPTTWSVPDVSTVSLCAGCSLPGVVTQSGTTTTAQRLGLGFRYSTVNAYFRHRAPYPIELSFTHLTTITGDSGVPRISSDQLQLRLYYQLRSR